MKKDIFQVIWMVLALCFIVQLAGIKTELKRIAFSVGRGEVFLMQDVGHAVNKARK